MKKKSIFKFCFGIIVSILMYQILLSTISMIVASQITSVKIFTNRKVVGGVHLNSFDRKEIKPDKSLVSHSHDSTGNFYKYELPKKTKNDRISIHFLNEKSKTTEILKIHLLSNYHVFKIQSKKFSNYLQKTSPCLIEKGKYIFQKKEGTRIVLDFLPLSDIIKKEIRYTSIGILIFILCVLIAFLLERLNLFRKIVKKDNLSTVVSNGIFILILFTPMSIFFMHWDDEITSENRKLNSIDDVRAYIDVMFPYKSSLVYLNHFMNEKLFAGPHNVKQVAIGKDDFLFKYREGSDLASYFLRRKYISETKLDSIEKRIVDHQEYCKSNGIEYLRVYYPSKYDIYPENLPYALRSAMKDTISRKEQISNRLSKKGIDIVSFEKIFKKYNYMPIYRKKDTHWNNLGGFFAYQHIMQSLYEKTNIESYVPTNLDDYSIGYTVIDEGDIIAKLAYYPYNITDMCPNLYPKFDYEFKLTSDKRLPYNSVKITNSKSKSNKTVLVFSDSFVIAQRKFYAMHFGTVYHLRDEPFNKELIELLKPDVIIEGYTENTHNNLIY